MPDLNLTTHRLAYSLHGPANAPALLLIGELGTTAAMWDALLPLLPHQRLIAPDLRGHGGATLPPGKPAFGALVRDSEALLDRLELSDTVVLGIGLGGMVAQALAVKRLDLVRGLVLIGTGAKLGTKAGWEAQASRAEREGLAQIAATEMPRWFSKRAMEEGRHEATLTAFESTDPQAYAHGARALAGTDLIAPTSGLRLPTLVIAGREDRAVPPDMARDLADLIPGARFTLLPQAGHLPPVDAAPALAQTLTEFLTSIGHGGPECL